MSDFWDNNENFFTVESAIDTILQSRNLEGEDTALLQQFTDAFKEKAALPLPVSAGTRVSFIANLGSVLSYNDIPEDNIEGTVILVKGSEGNTTSDENRVFVSWDDGKFRAILAEHLKALTTRSASTTLKVSNLGEISSIFNVVASSSDELIHKATKDLWSFQEGKEGFVIERLFNSKGEPLKG